MLNRKKFTKRLLSSMLSVSLVVTSYGVIIPDKISAEEEKKVYATHTYDSSYDTQNAYSGDDLGCTYTPSATTFKVWSPLATGVKLCLYDAGNGGSATDELEMTKGDKGVWSITVNKDLVNKYYTYKVTADGVTKEAVDIYAKAAGVNGDRAMVVDLDSTDPDNWDKDYKREKTLLSDIIVWEVHVRDFSIDVTSGVSKENRGKYKAFTETDTTLNGEGKIPTCVNYLKKLGVTHVQIMPMYDYASVDETKVTTDLSDNYNWGYDPKNYNVPEGSYSSNPYDGNVRIKEMKQMIQALHDAGIKVIMDVVYNHTYATEDSNFNKIMPDYYYKINSDMSYNNQSGCGNATRSESAMYRKFMIDSLTYWADEYNLDGFRFDLMGIHDAETMNQIRSTLDNKFGEDTIVLYGEGWTGDGSSLGNSAHKKYEANLDDGIGYFNDQIRDAIKGEHKFDGTIGLVQTNYYTGSYLEEGQKWPNNVFGGIMGSVGKTDGDWGEWRPFWSKSSNCVVSYTSAHDNLTLWDKLTEGAGKNYTSTDTKLINMNKMAGAVILTSKGGAFMQAGEEFARTKNGDDNSYKSADSVNKIDWSRVNTYSQIQQYYQGIIKIRKAFSGFRSITTRSGDNWHPNNNNLNWLSTNEKGTIAFYETNSVKGEWSKLAVLINNATTDTSVDLSSASSEQWVIIADGTKAGLEKIKESSSNVSVPAKSVVIAVPKGTFDECNITENHAPQIITDTTIDVIVGENASFTVNTSDEDNDIVTLSAGDLPDGANFNASTGVFTWENAKLGSYKITFTATDGKATVTKNVTLNVTDKWDAVKKEFKDIEDSSYDKNLVTNNEWISFSTRISVIQGLMESDEDIDAEQITEQLKLLKECRKIVDAQLSARNNCQTAIDAAAECISTAEKNSDKYDSSAIEDLKNLVEESNTYMKSAHTESQYESYIEDVKMATDTCVPLKAVTVLRVKASGWSSPAVYIWQDNGTTAEKLSGEWPGTVLTNTDSEGWYVFELPEGTTNYNVIVNDGAASTSTQTSDITGVKECADITVTSFTGKTCSYTKNEYDAKGGKITPDKSVLSKQIQIAEKTVKDYDNKKVEELQNILTDAKAVYDKDEVSQVEINQNIRKLKACIENVVSYYEEPTTGETTTGEQPTTGETTTGEQPTTGETTTKEQPSTGETTTKEQPSTGETTTKEQPSTGETTTKEQPSTGETTTKEQPTTGETTTKEQPSTGETTTKEQPSSGETTTKEQPSTGETTTKEQPSTGETTTKEQPSSGETTTKEQPTTGETTTKEQPTSEEPTNELFDELEVITLSLNKASNYVSVGEKIKIKTRAEGGYGKIRYRYEISSSKKTITSDYNTSSVVYWTPNTPGTYTITVTAVDSLGNTATKSFDDYVVNKKLAVSKFKLSTASSKYTAGKAIKLTSKASGGSGKYLYKFAYRKTGEDFMKTIRKYGSSSSTKWTPKSKGKYVLYVYIKDKVTRKLVKKSIKIKVK